MVQYREQLDSISGHINELINDQKSVGLSLAIVKGSNNIYSEGFVDFPLNKESPILRSDLIEEMKKPIHLVSDEWKFGSNARSYGLAWFIDTNKGYKIVEHGGGQLAVRSLMTMVPELDWESLCY